MNPACKELGMVVGDDSLADPGFPRDRLCIPPTDYKAFEDAAEEFHPYIPFFATFDSKVLLATAVLVLPHVPKLSSTFLSQNRWLT